MKFFLCKSQVEVQGIAILIFWGLFWLYKHLIAQDDSISNKSLDPVKEQDDDGGIIPSVRSLPSSKKWVDKDGEVDSLPHLGANNPSSSEPIPCVIDKHQSSFSRKRKFFKNALLIRAIMERKNL